MKTPDHLLVRMARGEVVERTPVWALRQVGHWDPEFCKLRGNRKLNEFLMDTEVTTKASLLPRRFGVDAIVPFYDITAVAVAMGLLFELRPEVGPMPVRWIRSRSEVEKLSARPDPVRYELVLKLLSEIKQQVNNELPILAFAGGPFTIASCCIGAGKDITSARRFADAHPDTWAALLDRITEATIVFLTSLVLSGADAYQIYDPGAGKLSSDEYDRWAHRFHRQIFRDVADVPRFLFVKECPHVEAMIAAGADVVSLGATHDLKMLRQNNPGITFQGNVSEDLLRHGSPAHVMQATQQCLERGGGHRHILNVSYGLARDVPVENVVAFLATGRASNR